MAIYVAFLESDGSELKKVSLEAVAYAAEWAKQTNGSVVGFAVGPCSEQQLKLATTYGLQEVFWANTGAIGQLHALAITETLSAFLKEKGAEGLVMMKSALSDAIGASIAAETGGSFVSNVVALPNLENGFVVKRSVFTNKGFAEVKVGGGIKVLSIKKNTIQLPAAGAEGAIQSIETKTDAAEKAKIVSQNKSISGVSLADAEIVVCGGRGFKGPEHFGIMEEFAKKLGAATGCSKPVSDADWRPHHEHVGQTGVKIAPSLYFGIGISGAIQHIAGVNSSKVIVVINKDPEAPFFKVADYGIVGDLFEVLPKLTAALD